jgi:hypothetical protein
VKITLFGEKEEKGSLLKKGVSKSVEECQKGRKKKDLFGSHRREKVDLGPQRKDLQIVI